MYRFETHAYFVSFLDLSSPPSKCSPGCASDSDCDASTGFGRCDVTKCECGPNPCPELPNDPNSDLVVQGEDRAAKKCRGTFVISGTGKIEMSIGMVRKKRFNG